MIKHTKIKCLGKANDRNNIKEQYVRINDTVFVKNHHGYCLHESARVDNFKGKFKHVFAGKYWEIDEEEFFLYQCNGFCSWDCYILEPHEDDKIYCIDRKFYYMDLEQQILTNQFSIVEKMYMMGKENFIIALWDIILGFSNISPPYTIFSFDNNSLVIASENPGLWIGNEGRTITKLLSKLNTKIKVSEL